MKYQGLFLAFVLIAAPTWAETIKARQCNKGQCATWKIERLNGDNRLTAWADARLKKDVGISQLNTAALQNRLRKEVSTECQTPEFSNNFSTTGRTTNYQQIRYTTEEYTCGAHGMTTIQYSVFSQANPSKPLSLNDIVLPNQVAKLNALQKSTWIQYLKKNSVGQEEINSLLPDFKPTQNWRFSKNGLTFQFQPYEIAPYAMGAPEITVPISQLQGVVKPEILREMASFKGK